MRLSPDFGVAVRQDQAAQIADPDARYNGAPAAGSDGARTTIAVTRYRTDKVKQPVSAPTSDVGGSNGGGSGNGGGGGSGADGGGSSGGAGSPQ